jgi:hypothetical protein
VAGIVKKEMSAGNQMDNFRKKSYSDFLTGATPLFLFLLDKRFACDIL